MKTKIYTFISHLHLADFAFELHVLVVRCFEYVALGVLLLKSYSRDWGPLHCLDVVLVLSPWETEFVLIPKLCFNTSLQSGYYIYHSFSFFISSLEIYWHTVFHHSFTSPFCLNFLITFLSLL